MSSFAESHLEDESYMECPECQSTIPIHRGYITWCECGYNLHSLKEEQSKKSRIDRLYEHLGEKSGELVFSKMMDRTYLNRKLSLINVLALLIATLVHVVSLASFLLGMYLLFFQFSQIISMFFGCVLLGISWVTRPKVGKLEKSDRIIPREEMPVTYDVLDELASSMGVRKIDGIIVNEEYNASICKIGWKRKTIVRIGVPLFSAMTTEEQCSIIAHELGHYLNKDLTYGFYVGTALGTLYDWYTLLNPVPSEQTFEYSILDMITNLFMKILSQVPYFMCWLLLHLLWNKMQINEYMADYRAAQMCGSQTMINGLEKLHFDRVYNHRLSKISVNDLQTNVIDEFKYALSVMPEREKKRTKLQLANEKFQLDATHPPTIFRIQFLQKQNLLNRLSIDSKKAKQMSEELDSFKERVHEIAVENYRYYWLH